MDRAYEGNKTRSLAVELGFIVVVSPLKSRIDPWAYDQEIYKRRNEVERLFRRLKGVRRIFTRYELARQERGNVPRDLCLNDCSAKLV